MPYFGPYFAQGYYSIYWRPITAVVRAIRRALIRRSAGRPDPTEATVD